MTYGKEEMLRDLIPATWVTAVSLCIGYAFGTLTTNAIPDQSEVQSRKIRQAHRDRNQGSY